MISNQARLRAIHLVAENASTTEPAELLATFYCLRRLRPLTIPD
ncbi:MULTISPECIES: hypothetical protein [unclassified Mesorhizobium]|nr:MULTISPECIES: hypothetical protein [unclassified Mesorhizobium]